MSATAQSERPAAGSGLFRRIYITFVITVYKVCVMLGLA